LAYVFYRTGGDESERRAQIHIQDLPTGAIATVLDLPSTNGFIVDLIWSPTGERLAFAMDEEITNVGGQPEYEEDLYTINVDGSGFRMLTNGKADVVSPNFSPDGEKILYVDRSNPRVDHFLQVANLHGSCHRLVTPLPDTTIRSVTLSPDGEKIAFYTQIGLLLADTRLALGEDFWLAGTSCIP
jgi:Tol biopolymer transport system component